MILLAGAMGYVGALIRRHFEKSGDLLSVDVRGTTAPGFMRCDLSDPDAVRRLARSCRPNVVIHAAGNKDIGHCERNPEEAFRINCDTTKNIATFFGENCPVIYISTDYVFRGDRGRYTETDIPEPVTVYGKSKLCGEKEGRRIAGERFIVLRTSAIYDLGATFPRVLKSELEAGRRIECFTDIVYSPTYYKDFLDALEKVVVKPAGDGGPFHVCGEPTTRFAFGRAFAEAFGFDLALVAPSSGAGNAPFLFPDLSMSNERTRCFLDLGLTSTARALRELKEERDAGD